MSSSISTSEPSGWRRALSRYAAACVAVGGLVAALLLAIDPYDTGRLAVFDGFGVPASLGPSLAKASIGRQPDAEAGIVGNSTIQLVDPARVGAATGLRFVSLSVAGTGPDEQMAVARWFLRHHPNGAANAPKAMVFSVDRIWCQADGRLVPPNPFPFWLYSASFFDYAVNMLRLKTFEAVDRKLKLMLGRAPAWPADGYRDYDTGHVWTREAAERALNEPERSGSPSDPPDFAGVRRLHALLDELPAATDVVLVFPPRFRASLPPAGSVAERLETACKAAFRDLAAVRARTAVVDLAVDGEIARDERNFWESTHYRQPVARAVEGQIAGAIGALRSAARNDHLAVTLAGR